VTAKKGSRVALVAAVVACVSVGGATLAVRRHLVEGYYQWKLRSAQDVEQIAAIQVLTDLGAESSVELILDVLEQEMTENGCHLDTTDEGHLILVLPLSGYNAALPIRCIESLRSLAMTKPKEVSARLLRFLATGSLVRRFVATQLVGDIGESTPFASAAVGDIVTNLHQSDSTLQHCAIVALRKLKNLARPAIPRLRELVRCENTKVANAARVAVVDIGRN